MAGDNGSGKSTLLKLLLKKNKSIVWHKTDKNDVDQQNTFASKAQDVHGLDCDMDVAKKARPKNISDRFQISFIGHEPGLYSSLTLKENLDYFGGIAGKRFLRDRMSHLLKVFKLDHRLHDPVHTFSRGMLQKSAIIRALCMDAYLYLLDEPYTGLDETSVSLLNDIILDLKKRSSVLLVVHSKELIKKVAERTIALDAGSII